MIGDRPSHPIYRCYNNRVREVYWHDSLYGGDVDEPGGMQPCGHFLALARKQQPLQGWPMVTAIWLGVVGFAFKSVAMGELLPSGPTSH